MTSFVRRSGSGVAAIVFAVAACVCASSVFLTGEEQREIVGGVEQDDCWYPTTTTCLELAENSCGGACVWNGTGGSQLFGEWECPPNSEHVKNRDIPNAVGQCLGIIPGYETTLSITADCYDIRACGCPNNIPPGRGGSGGACGKKGPDIDSSQGQTETPDGDICWCDPS
ncbi:hypothetical protein Mal65_11300 [Crateriforma conspicua]|nr:hypothetical protein Mal65_11300 [Crateriforma conspicua]